MRPLACRALYAFRLAIFFLMHTFLSSLIWLRPFLLLNLAFLCDAYFFLVSCFKSARLLTEKYLFCGMCARKNLCARVRIFEDRRSLAGRTNAKLLADAKRRANRRAFVYERAKHYFA